MSRRRQQSARHPSPWWLAFRRELENTIERAVVLGSSECILLKDLPEELLEFFSTHQKPKA